MPTTFEPAYTFSIQNKMPIKCYVTVTRILHLTAIYFLSHLESLKYSLFASHICFYKCLSVLRHLLKYFACEIHIYTLIYMITYVFLFGRCLFFISSDMLITLEIVHTCVSIHNTHALPIQIINN